MNFVFYLSRFFIVRCSDGDGGGRGGNGEDEAVGRVVMGGLARGACWELLCNV